MDQTTFQIMLCGGVFLVPFTALSLAIYIIWKELEKHGRVR